MISDEVCWEVVNALFKEFPSLRERAREYLKN
jgi:hypothetical protein